MHAYQGGGGGQKTPKICLRNMWKPPNISQILIFHEFFAKFLRIFCDRPREESVCSACHPLLYFCSVFQMKIFNFLQVRTIKDMYMEKPEYDEYKPEHDKFNLELASPSINCSRKDWSFRPKIAELFLCTEKYLNPFFIYCETSKWFITL